MKWLRNLLRRLFRRKAHWDSLPWPAPKPDETDGQILSD
jgi:hypothetical protein